MKNPQEFTNEEILEIFGSSYFLETSSCFIRCCKKTHQTNEVISKMEMQTLNFRYLKIAKFLYEYETFKDRQAFPSL
jgi:hypothetical protein